MLTLLMRAVTSAVAIREIDVSVQRCCQAMRWRVTVRLARETSGP